MTGRAVCASAAEEDGSGVTSKVKGVPCGASLLLFISPGDSI